MMSLTSARRCCGRPLGVCSWEDLPRRTKMSKLTETHFRTVGDLAAKKCYVLMMSRHLNRLIWVK